MSKREMLPVLPKKERICFFALLPTKNKAKTMDARSKTNIKLKCGGKTEWLKIPKPKE